MKHVVAPEMVAHLWANQSQANARTSARNLSFEGVLLFSYSARIGRMVASVEGAPVALVVSQKWSVTTSGHQSMAMQAARGASYRVPSIGDEYAPVDHAMNLEYLVAEYRKSLDEIRRKRDTGTYAYDYSERIGRTAMRYAVAFGLVAPDFDIEADHSALAAFRVERELRLNSPELLAKREQARVRKAEALAIEHAEAVAAWRLGTASYLPLEARLDASGGALLRIRGELLQTSLGASVPVVDAVRVFRRVLACKQAGISWKRNGDTIRVGQFQVDSINLDGSFVAGCHVINWPEIEAAARVAGLLEIA